jgi:L-lactate dehydrogenase complex protein LldG
MILEKLYHAVASDVINKNIIEVPEPRPGDGEVFAGKATAAGAQVFSTNLPEAAGVTKSVLEEIGSSSIILSDEKIIKELGVQAIAADLGIACRYADDYPGEAYRRNVLQTEIGISGCDYALADSGSLVIIHDRENQRLISLAPDYYIGIVKTSQLLKDRFDLASILEKEGRSAAVSIITGVSRTADVALQVVLGMHGPRKVYIILVED